MAVDILDNYNDYHHATKFMIIRKNEYYRSRKFIFAINTQNDFWMILVSALMGIGLSFIVGWPLLIMGLYCYLIGIFIHQDRNLYLVYH